MKQIGFKVISEQDCKEPREVEKMRKDKSTSDKKLAADFERLEGCQGPFWQTAESITAKKPYLSL